MLVTPTLRMEGERFAELVEKLDKLHESMVVTRKVLRFGMSLPLLRDILGPKGSCPFWHTVSQAALLVYYLLDHPLYLKRIGVLALSQKAAAKLEWQKNVLRLVAKVI